MQGFQHLESDQENSIQTPFVKMLEFFCPIHPIGYEILKQK